MPTNSQNPYRTPVLAQHDIRNAPVLIRRHTLPDEKGSVLTGDHLQDLCFLSVFSGSMRLEMNEKDILLEEGDVILLQADRPYTLQAADRCTFCTLHANPVLFQSSLALPHYILDLFSPSSPSCFLLKKGQKDTEYVSDLLDRIIQLPDDSLLSYRLTIMGYLHLILARFLTCIADDPSYNADRILPESGNLDRMLHYIHCNFRSKIRLEDIADAGNVSRSRCSPIFRKYMHMTPIEYVNDYRLEVSRGYLSDRSISIASIASSCGFSGQSYYTKLFVRKYGCTPSEYRSRGMD